MKKVAVKPRQYFYRRNECKAATAHSPDCICWHDEGAGPLGKTATACALEWRDKPTTNLEKAKPQ